MGTVVPAEAIWTDWPDPNGQRIAWFDASWDVLIASFMSRSLREITSTLPDDARVRYLVLNHERRMVRVFFESTALQPVPEAGLIPEFIVSLGTLLPTEVVPV